MNIDRIEKGIRRLLTSPLDLKFCGLPISKFRHRSGSIAHQRLFSNYLTQLNIVIPVALDWWNETVTARQYKSNNEENGLRQALIERPAGPASYPGLVALIRDYWLLCYKLNLDVHENENVPPEIFMLGWLVEREMTEAVEVITYMPYWPLGLDEQNNWC